MLKCRWIIVAILLILFAGMRAYPFPETLKKSRVEYDQIVLVHDTSDSKIIYALTKNTRRLVGFTYFSTIGLKEVCKEYGYDLVVYPNVFKEKLAEELEIIDREIEKIGFTPDEFYNVIIKREYTVKTKDGRYLPMDEGTRYVFEEARRGLNLRLIAKVKKIDRDQLTWKPEYDGHFDEKKTCKIMDQAAEAIASEDKLIFQKFLAEEE